MKSIVDYTNKLKDFFASNTALTTKVNTSDIANNLTTTASGKVLDARQGKALNDTMAFKVVSNGTINNPNIDPNTITTTSLYNLNNQANLPDLGWWFLYTHVHTNGDGFIAQIAIKMTDNWHEVCIRNKVNGVWNAWEAFATQGTYRTQTKTVTLTANAGDWSYQTITWDTAFVETPHVTVAVSGNSYIPEPIALITYSKTQAQVGMYDKAHNVTVQITATGWVRE